MIALARHHGVSVSALARHLVVRELNARVRGEHE
jgi:hypothetical protein